MRYMLVLVLSFLLLNGATLNLMTEDYPPYNFPDKNGKPTGISVDIVREIIKKTKDIDNITILPWARAYHKIQTEKNQVLFSTTRTPQREKLFKWVGPIATNTWVFYTKKGNDIKLSKLSDAKNLKYTIGTYKDDACELFLKLNGFENIESVPNDTLNVKKLISNRIDLWIVGEYQGKIKAKRLNADKYLKKVFEIKKTYLYIAFSKDVDDKIIKKWQYELDRLKQNGIYQKILNKYLK